jgi:hypothetical protein
MAKIGVQDRLTDHFLPFREGVPHGDIVIHSWTREELDGLHVEEEIHRLRYAGLRCECRKPHGVVRKGEYDLGLGKHLHDASDKYCFTADGTFDIEDEGKAGKYYLLAL